LVAEWLGEKLVSIELPCEIDAAPVGPPRNQCHEGFVAGNARCPQGIHAAHCRHMNVDECQIDTMVERLQAFHAVKSMDDVRNVFGRQRVANKLVNSACIISDKYFRRSLLHQNYPPSAHRNENAERPQTFKVGTGTDEFLANLCLDKCRGFYSIASLLARAYRSRPKILCILFGTMTINC